MSCEDCELVQESGSQSSRCFIRIGNGNVEIVACPLHTGMAVALIRKAKMDIGVYQDTFIDELHKEI